MSIIQAAVSQGPLMIDDGQTVLQHGTRNLTQLLYKKQLMSINSISFYLRYTKI